MSSDKEKRNAYMREYNKKNRAKVRARARKWYNEHKDALPSRVYLMEQRKLGCEICGEMDPRCIQFHHKDPSQKKFSVGNGTPTMESLINELKKCVRICANCHCKIHYKEVPITAGGTPAEADGQEALFDAFE